ncbi:MAG: orotate phosphoribosyltransferase, partial [Pseudomonadota bacterium]|nr:orotate phosphoribosyltransferase [Pseudomonadota bacterium]
PYTALVRLDVPTFAADDVPKALSSIPAIKPGSRAA